MLNMNFNNVTPWNNSPRVHVTPSETPSYLQANQSLLLVVNASSLAEKQQIQML